MGMRKGQVAMEYMLIIGIVMLFIIPVWSYMTTVHRDTSNEIYSTYAENAARKIVDTADLVYSQGPPASVNTVVYIPRYVQWINITNKTVSIRMDTGQIQDISHFGIADLNGTLPISEGNYVIHVEAVGNYVQIYPVS
ncbi:MAG: hypothetical protein ABIH52_01045 [Candidatus Aenigmatarchaeota archaeon]|nr:hypothetical protein [Nanoarchaeota archaeon]